MQGEARTIEGSSMADVQVVSRMTEAAAVDVVKSRGSVQRWHADRRLGRSRRVVGIIVGQRTGSTHFFEACRLQERECVVTVPPIGLTTLESRVAFLLALVEVLETHKPLWHRAQQSHLLHQPVPRGLPERLGTGPTSSRTPLSVPAHRFRQDGRRPLSDHRRRRRQRPASTSTSTSGAPASNVPWPRTPPLSLTSRPRSPSFPAECGAPA